ncbi:MAG: hypothetical protein AAB413_03750 [Patescibacteria group bacterium]
MNWPIVQKTADEIVIRIPRRKKRTQTRSPDFSYLIGALSGKEFKGKTSVEVQHMIKDIWAEKYFS